MAAASQLVSSSSVQPSASAGGDSVGTIISRDGRYVLFSSSANNLVITSNGTAFAPLFPAKFNVFLRDRTNGITTLVSVSADGTSGGNGDSFAMGISSNAQFALFESSASNLVAGDSNKVSDVFLRDLVNGTTTLVSVATNGGFANGLSRSSVMSADGRYVAFVSSANNLVIGDTNGIADVFVRDVMAGITTQVSVGATATNIALESSSEAPDITPDGRYIAYFTTATNLMPGVATAGEIYLRDRVNGTTTWASQGAHAVMLSLYGSTNVISYNEKLSDDGQYVAYLATSTTNSSFAIRPAVVLRYNVSSGLTDVVNTNALGARYGLEADFRGLDFTPDSRFIVFITNLSKTISFNAVAVWDAQSAVTTLASGDLSNNIPPNSDCYWPQISANGRFVAFVSSATNLTANPSVTNYHLYLRDLQAQVTTLADSAIGGLTPAYMPFNAASISTNGTVIAFDSFSPNLVTNDFNRSYDVFVRDITASANELISVKSDSLPSSSADGASYFSAFSVSTNARYLAFYSEADNLATNDTNNCRDIFVHDLFTGSNILASVAMNGFSGSGPSTDASISSNGRFVAFTSMSSNLVAGDLNGTQDVFVRDLQSGLTLLVSTNLSGTGSGNAASYSPILSSDGRYVLFRSKASNLAAGFSSTTYENLYRYDIQLGTMISLTTNNASVAYCAAMTPDGRYVAYGGAGSTSYLWDLQAFKKIYTNAAGFTNVALSPDARKLAYTASNQVYLVDLVASTNLLLGNSATGSHAGMQFSSDDRFLAYTAAATGQISQVYLYDTQTGSNLLVSQNVVLFASGNGSSDSPTISPDGRFIAYRSLASNLVSGDSNNLPDILLYDRVTGSNSLVTLSQYGSYSGNNRSLTPVFSADSQTFLFQSWASDLVTQDFNAGSDLFAYALNGSNTLSLSFIAPGTIVWNAAVGKSYQVQFKNDLSDATWQNLNGSLTLIGNQWIATDPSPSASHRFYRVAAY